LDTGRFGLTDIGFYINQLLTQTYNQPWACTIADLPYFIFMVITQKIVKHRIYVS
jgi:hypothetical protein